MQVAAELPGSAKLEAPDERWVRSWQPPEPPGSQQQLVARKPEHRLACRTALIEPVQQDEHLGCYSLADRADWRVYVGLLA